MGFTSLKENLKGTAARSLTVAWGADEEVLKACALAVEHGFLDEVIVTGPAAEIEASAEQAQIDLQAFQITPASTVEEASALAVELVKVGRCSILMKGNLNTSVILRAVLHKERGIRAQALLSHIAAVELPGPRLALLTDAGMNIKPDLSQKFQILDNAIRLAWSLSLPNPKAAVLAAIETVNPQMPETLDAAALALMGKRGQFTKPAAVDGPLAFDNAYCEKAARRKGIDSPVAGKADIFLVPEIITGNILYKAFTYIGRLPTCGLIYGASCPIVLGSRADSVENKFYGIVTACQMLRSQ